MVVFASANDVMPGSGFSGSKEVTISGVSGFFAENLHVSVKNNYTYCNRGEQRTLGGLQSQLLCSVLDKEKGKPRIKVRVWV